MPPMRGRPLSPEMQATLDAIRARVGFTAPANNFGYTGHQDPATGQWIGGGGPNPMLSAAAAYGNHPRGPHSLAAARWNYAMLQYRSGRGPHPGPHPIAGVDSQMPAQTPGQTPGGTTNPTPTPTAPTTYPWVGLPPAGEPMFPVAPAPPPVGPGGGAPPAQGFGDYYAGGPAPNPELFNPPPATNLPANVQPVGGTNVPSNVGPLGTSRGGGTNYLSYFLGR